MICDYLFLIKQYATKMYAIKIGYSKTKSPHPSPKNDCCLSQMIKESNLEL